MESTATTPTPRPLRRDAERNRRRILDAAAAVFAERGLGASLDDIAQHAEVGVGTVYRRFPEQGAADRRALRGPGARASSRSPKPALAIEDPWDGLEHFMRSALERQAANRGLKELILGARMGNQTGCAAVGRQRIEPLVRRLVERAQADGSLRDDVDTTDMPLIQMMVGAVVDYTRNVGPGRLAAAASPLVLDGLRAAAGDPHADADPRRWTAMA